MGAAPVSLLPDCLVSEPPSGRVLSMVDLFELDAERSHGDSGLIAGDRVGDATLVAPMRRGAAVTAWSAEGPDGPCAVLVLDKRAPGTDRLAFAASARKMAEIAQDHPIEGLLRVYHVSPDGQAFVADLLSVGSIADMHALGWHLQRRLALFKTVCQIVGELHLRGVVHGALSPNNVLLDDGLQPVIIDIQFPTASSQPYAAPEGPGTIRADIYSLGMILAFVLSGEEPLPTPKDSSPVLHGSADIPHELLKVVWGCTSKDPARRFPSIAALVASFPSEMTAFALADTPDLRRAAPPGPPQPFPSVEASPRRSIHTGPAHQSWHDGDARGSLFDTGRRSIPDLGRRSIPDLGRRSIPDLGRTTMIDHLARRTVMPTLAEMDSPFASETHWGLVAGGALVIAGGMTFSFLLGDQVTTLASVLAVGAAAAIAFGCALEKKIHKVAVFALIVAIGFLVGPFDLLQSWGEGHRLVSGSPESRVATLTKLANAGRRDFPGLSLVGCDLEGIDLAQADLSHSDLSGTRLANSHLAGVVFDGAVLDGTNFAGAEMTNADVSNASNFQGAICDEGTAMPEDWRCADGHPIAVPHVQFDPNPVVISPSVSAQ